MCNDKPNTSVANYLAVGNDLPAGNTVPLPSWLDTMRRLTGTKEFIGTSDNPVILGMATAIASAYPDTARYCREYTHDSIPWCGLTIAYCMAVNGIKPVMAGDGVAEYGFLWANDWLAWGVPCSPKPGAIMVFTRNGAGHVALYEDEDKDNYIIRGGNQSDAINVIHMSKSQFSGARWPH